MEPLTQMLASAGTLAMIAAGFWAAAKLAWVKLMRDYIADQEKKLAQKDQELADFRLQNEGLGAKVKLLTDKSAMLENRTIQQGAILYGKLRYIRRLEKIVIAAGRELPPRNGLGEDD